MSKKSKLFADLEVLPSHLEEVKKFVDPPTKVQVKLPVYTLLSPRTRRKLAVLPKPNEFELQIIRKLEKDAKSIPGKEVYKQLPSPRHNSLLEKEILQSDVVYEVSEQSKMFIPNYFNPSNVTFQSNKYFEQGKNYWKKREERLKQLTRLFGDGHDNQHSSNDTVNNNTDTRSHLSTSQSHSRRKQQQSPVSKPFSSSSSSSKPSSPQSLKIPSQQHHQRQQSRVQSRLSNKGSTPSSPLVLPPLIHENQLNKGTKFKPCSQQEKQIRRLK
jgi:hypothetical protein